MKSAEIFALGLGLKDPWYIEEIKLEGQSEKKTLHIYLSHKTHSLFEYEGIDYTVYDRPGQWTAKVPSGKQGDWGLDTPPSQ